MFADSLCSTPTTGPTPARSCSRTRTFAAHIQLCGRSAVRQRQRRQRAEGGTAAQAPALAEPAAVALQNAAVKAVDLALSRPKNPHLVDKRQSSSRRIVRHVGHQTGLEFPDARMGDATAAIRARWQSIRGRRRRVARDVDTLANVGLVQELSDLSTLQREGAITAKSTRRPRQSCCKPEPGKEVAWRAAPRRLGPADKSPTPFAS